MEGRIVKALYIDLRSASTFGGSGRAHQPPPRENFEMADLTEAIELTSDLSLAARRET